MPDADPRLMTLFGEALELSDPSARAAYLDRACSGDAELRRRVEALLTAHASAGRFLEPDDVRNPTSAPQSSLDFTGSFPADKRLRSDMLTGEHLPSGATGTFSGTTTFEHAAGVGVGAVIAGRYTLVEVIGEGGMGTVYRASQGEPVKRSVALKLIKSGMDSKAVLARFDAERQALALMDHPNIARVFDGGTTATGQPFFVMELVNGVSITEYCDHACLPIRARLELFVTVCQAVQHAHQKGIIHRDLKPTNVLVTEVDGRPTPKVIDFGVAKATERKLTDLSFVDTGVIVGTPQYMSPEQADPTSMDIDTRTDVYALGVILYELLVGSPPIDKKQFKRGAMLEMLRLVREADPLRPSKKFSTAENRPNIAAYRGTVPAKLARLLHGELDWVVMKALEKDRTLRYDSANAFAADVHRYLADEVVEARSPTSGYRLRKFIRRHKGQVVLASSVLLALLFGSVGVTLALFEAKAQERQAITARNDADAKADAEVKARARAEAITAFVIRALNTSDPMQQGKQEATIAQAMARAIAEIEAGVFRSDMATEAELKDTIGNVLKNNGKYQQARPLLEQALATRQRLFPGDNADVAHSLTNLAALHVSEGHFDRAEPLLTQAQAMCERLYGPEHPNVGATLNSLGALYYMSGDLDRAEPLLRRALAIREKALGFDHRDVATTLNDLALLYAARLKYADAERLMQRSLAAYEKSLGPNHPDVAASLNSLAILYDNQDEYGRAEPLYVRALGISERALGPEHPVVGTALYNLAELYRKSGRYADSEPLFQRALAVREKAFGPNHPEVGIVLNNLALIYHAQGKDDVAAPLFERALAIDEQVFGLADAQVGFDLHNLAACYESLKLYSKAENCYTRALMIREKTLGPSHIDVGTTLHNFALCLRSDGNNATAEPLAERASAIYRAALGPDHPDYAVVLSTLALIQNTMGKTAEARRGFEQAVAILSKKSPNGSAALARVLWRSATARLETNMGAEFPVALHELEEALAMGKAYLPLNHIRLKEYGDTLAKCKAAIAEGAKTEKK